MSYALGGVFTWRVSEGSREFVTVVIVRSGATTTHGIAYYGNAGPLYLRVPGSIQRWLYVPQFGVRGKSRCRYPNSTLICEVLRSFSQKLSRVVRVRSCEVAGVNVGLLRR